MEWEYLIWNGPTIELAMLNRHGDDGWELVSLVNNVTNFVMVFKRPKAES